MNVVMLVNNPCVSDARVIREAEALAAAGQYVTVLACAAEGVAPSETINGVSYRRLTRRGGQYEASATDPDGRKARRRKLLPGWLPQPVAEKLYTYVGPVADLVATGVCWALLKVRRAIIRVATPTVLEFYRHWSRFSREIERLQPDVVHAHDLQTLWAGWRGARRTGARLIYDSHELEMGRNANYSAWHRAIRHLGEGYLIKKTDAVITVCDSIADYLAEHYQIPRPVVILNAPQEQSLESAETLRQRLGLAQDVPLCVSVGKTAINRGLDLAVRALPLYPEAHLALVGHRDERVAQSLRALAADLGVTDRVHFVDPVPHYEVLGFVASADVSLILVQNICLSYYMCFPNKLLESLLAGLPVVAGRLVELERVVGETGAGVIIDETDPAAIAQGIREVVANRERYSPGPDVLDFIRRKYGWETQRVRLADLYEDLRPENAAAALADPDGSAAVSQPK